MPTKCPLENWPNPASLRGTPFYRKLWHSSRARTEPTLSTNWVVNFSRKFPTILVFGRWASSCLKLKQKWNKNWRCFNHCRTSKSSRSCLTRGSRARQWTNSTATTKNWTRSSPPLINTQQLTNFCLSMWLTPTPPPTPPTNFKSRTFSNWEKKRKSQDIRPI